MSRHFTYRAWLLAGASLLISADCGFQRPNSGPDKDPPQVAIVGEVPTHTREQRLSLAAQATDVMGVTHVWCSFNNGPAIAAHEGDGGEWVCAGDLVPNSANVVAIWAEDGAGNSGVSGKPPYMQVLTIVHDDMALGVSLNGAAPATYYDESKMTVGTVTPPVYDRNGIGLEVVRPGEAIHKAATRLASRTLTTSAGDLEGTNPDNLPWLQFAVSLTGSPLATATYTIDVTAGGTAERYSGDLFAWRSPQSSAAAAQGIVYFDLPLDSVRIPVLTTASGPVSLTVRVDVVDGAGNEGGEKLELTYHVIGPPLNIAVDSGYASSGSRNSTYPYKIADGTYGTLFSAGDFSTFGSTQEVRLARLVVTNPAPDPVALDVSSISASAWAMTETWSGQQTGVTGTYTFNDSACPGDNQEAKNHTTMYAPLGGSLGLSVPEVASVGWAGAAASANLASVAELPDISAVPKVGSRYIVPAAVGSAPGVVSLYITRPLAVGRTPGAPALGASPYRKDVGTLYTFASERNASSGCCVQGYVPTVYYQCRSSKMVGCRLAPCENFTSAWHETGRGTYCLPGPVTCPLNPPRWLAPDFNNGLGTPCTNCTNTCACSQFVQAQVYNLVTYYQQLSAATEGVSLTFAPVTQPIDETGSVYGVANAGAASIALNSSFDH